MKPFLCRILGHDEYSTEVRATQPWLDPDFSGYDELDFREQYCQRCGKALQRTAA
jgi:hypothetical protein